MAVLRSGTRLVLAVAVGMVVGLVLAAMAARVRLWPGRQPPPRGARLVGLGQQPICDSFCIGEGTGEKLVVEPDAAPAGGRPLPVDRRTARSARSGVLAGFRPLHQAKSPRWEVAPREGTRAGDPGDRWRPDRPAGA